MIRSLSLVSILLSLLLMACSDPTTAKPPISPSSVSQTPTLSGQKLPISAKAIFPNRTIIELEVARTPQEQQIGLMYRRDLPANRGMLFKFPSAQAVSFWMKNTLIPLDMVFMHNGVVQYIAAAVPPCTADPCPGYGPRKQIDMVIELRSGRAAELKLKVGERVKIDYLSSALSR